MLDRAAAERKRWEASSDDQKRLFRSRLANPKGVDWATFHRDVTAMCDAAVARDPQGTSGGFGTLGNLAAKIRTVRAQNDFKVSQFRILDFLKVRKRR